MLWVVSNTNSPPETRLNSYGHTGVCIYRRQHKTTRCMLIHLKSYGHMCCETQESKDRDRDRDRERDRQTSRERDRDIKTDRRKTKTQPNVGENRK